MSYPYTDPAVDFIRQKQDFEVLSQVSEGTTKCFDRNFSQSMPRVSALNLDLIAQKGFRQYSGNPLCSCDALLKGDDNCYYLVEFKNQRCSNIKKEELHKKIIDSISLIMYCFEPSTTLQQLTRRIKVYVVYPDQDPFMKIVGVVKDSAQPRSSNHKRPFWNLDNLVNNAFVAEVNTESLSEFRASITTWPAMILP